MNLIRGYSAYEFVRHERKKSLKKELKSTRGITGRLFENLVRNVILELSKDLQIRIEYVDGVVRGCDFIIYDNDHMIPLLAIQCKEKVGPNTGKGQKGGAVGIDNVKNSLVKLKELNLTKEKPLLLMFYVDRNLGENELKKKLEGTADYKSFLTEKPPKRWNSYIVNDQMLIDLRKKLERLAGSN